MRTCSTSTSWATRGRGRALTVAIRSSVSAIRALATAQGGVPSRRGHGTWNPSLVAVCGREPAVLGPDGGLGVVGTPTGEEGPGRDHARGTAAERVRGRFSSAGRRSVGQSTPAAPVAGVRGHDLARMP